MKFKVGDTVKIRKDLKKGDNFEIYVDSDMEELAGEIVTIKKMYKYLSSERYEIDKDKGFYTWTEDMFESIKKPTKEELLEMPLGTIIKTNEKEHNAYVKVGKYEFFNDYDDISDDDINEDLSLDYNTVDIKIIEIQQPKHRIVYKEDNEVKEMTISEIEKEIGYQIKVVKEEK